MPFLSRQQINPDVLAQHLGEHRDRLRQILLDPSLTADQRLAVKGQLQSIGQAKGPKVYRQDSPAKPGAIDFPLSEGV